MVKPFSLNFRVCTVKLVGVPKFRDFTVCIFLLYKPTSAAGTKNFRCRKKKIYRIQATKALKLSAYMVAN